MLPRACFTSSTKKGLDFMSCAAWIISLILNMALSLQSSEAFAFRMHLWKYPYHLEAPITYAPLLSFFSCYFSFKYLTSILFVFLAYSWSFICFRTNRCYRNPNPSALRPFKTIPLNDKWPDNKPLDFLTTCTYFPSITFTFVCSMYTCWILLYFISYTQLSSLRVISTLFHPLIYFTTCWHPLNSTKCYAV